MLKSAKLMLGGVTAVCIAALGAALYLQHVMFQMPCPWCVIQRYEFVVVALVSAIGIFLSDAARRKAAMLGLLAAVAGMGSASWHMWVKAHPGFSCGLDPLETSLNKIPTATLLPWLFEADGMCSTEYPPVLGLSLPQWSWLCFAAFSVIMVLVIRRKLR